MFPPMEGTIVLLILHSQKRWEEMSQLKIHKKSFKFKIRILTDDCSLLHKKDYSNFADKLSFFSSMQVVIPPLKAIFLPTERTTLALTGTSTFLWPHFQNAGKPSADGTWHSNGGSKGHGEKWGKGHQGNQVRQSPPPPNSSSNPSKFHDSVFVFLFWASISIAN